MRVRCRASEGSDCVCVCVCVVGCECETEDMYKRLYKRRVRAFGIRAPAAALSSSFPSWVDGGRSSASLSLPGSAEVRAARGEEERRPVWFCFQGRRCGSVLHTWLLRVGLAAAVAAKFERGKALAAGRVARDQRTIEEKQAWTTGHLFPSRKHQLGTALVLRQKA